MSYNQGYGAQQGGYRDQQGGQYDPYSGGNGYGAYSAQDLHAGNGGGGGGYGAAGGGYGGAQGTRWGNSETYAPIDVPRAANAPRNSVWLEKQQARSRRSKWIIAAIVGLILLIAIAVGVGVTVSNNSKNKNNVAANTNGSSSSSSGSSSSSSNSNPSGGVTNSDPNDPSIFDKDPAFHKVFYGMAYTPVGSIMPDCGAKQSEVITDIQLMSQLTDTVRLYGADCNISALVLNAIKVTKVDMKVYLGNYISPSDTVAYTRQKANIEDALKTYGSDNVIGVTVGNEVMLNACSDAGIDDPNAAQVQSTANYIVTCLDDTRSSLATLGYSTLKVGNSDAGSYFSTAVLQKSDYGLANVHPWFAHTTVTDAVPWTWNFFQDTNVAFAATLSNTPEMFIAETGWPTGSKTADKGNTGVGVGGEASVANLQIFLDTFVCQSNQNQIKYFYFELFDEVWKDLIYGGVEGYWGLLDKDRKLKSGITLPTCS
ncbi:glycoside hydrolase [Auriculariales sp. MPI-PUGE-AT-0066]|nr:glycoside hydrolase [Auriculariales sp. MPI-PUGE-AT-0066]